MRADLQRPQKLEMGEAKRRVDEMNDILAEQLGLDPAELRQMPPAEALAMVGDALGQAGIRPEHVSGWHSVCVESPDYADCFRTRARRALKEPTSTATVVGLSFVGAGALAFAASWLRK